jgi:type IV secretory pathway VirB10-like protein
LREAKAEGERLIDAARAEVRRLAGEIEGLERARRAYLAQFRDLVARQLAELDAIPASPAAAISANGTGDDKVKEKEKPPVPAPVSATTMAPPPPPPVPDGKEPEKGTERPDEPTTAGGSRISVQTPAWLNVVPKE